MSTVVKTRVLDTNNSDGERAIKGTRRFAQGYVCAEPCVHPFDGTREINTSIACTWHPDLSQRPAVRGNDLLMMI